MSLLVTDFVPSSQLRAQDRFFLNLARLRVMLKENVQTRDWIVTAAEIGVQADRRGEDVDGIVRAVKDRVHMRNSLHYERRAADLNVFVPVSYDASGVAVHYRQVTTSDAPEWGVVHTMWTEMSPFNQVMPSGSSDANHLSIRVDGDPRI